MSPQTTYKQIAAKFAKAMRVTLLFVIGFSEQFFIQHNAVMNLAIYSIIFIYHIKNKNKRNNTELATLIIANIIGLTLLLGYKLYIDYDLTWASQPNVNVGKLIFSFNIVASSVLSLALTYVGSFALYTFYLFVLKKMH